MTQPQSEVKLTLTISRERIWDLLVGAFEGGSNYWYMIKKQIKPKEWTYFGSYNGDPVSEQTKYLHLYPLNEGGALMVDDSEADEPELKTPVRLDWDAVVKGLELFHHSDDMKHHWADFLNGNEDATTSDVFLQFCIFGKVIYG